MSSLQMTNRIRRTPFTRRVEEAGVSGFTVVNHMLLPKAFRHSVADDYWHLKEHVQIWDVSTQRQVEIKGPDAGKLVQSMTPRNLTKAKVGQCLYVPLVDERGGMVNDPVLLRLDDDHYWLSIADSDVLLWAKGLAVGRGLNVEVSEPDVSPLAIQGSKSDGLMTGIFGDDIRDIGFFQFGWFDFMGEKQLIARSGYSKQGGFEIYLNGSHYGEDLWDQIMAAGKKYDIRPGCPNLIERIEGGLLSYGNDFTLADNPLECGLEGYCDLTGAVDYIGLSALQEISNAQINRQMRGVIYEGQEGDAVTTPLIVLHKGETVGQITSGIWSPRFDRCVGVAIIDQAAWTPGTRIDVITVAGEKRSGEIQALPFKD